MKNILVFILLIGFSSTVYSQDEQTEFTYEENGKEYTMKRYFLCLLKEGPNRNQDEATAAKLQEQHMNHLNEMAESGKLVIAGPMGDDTYLRGILIFSDVENEEEVRKMAEADPAVQAGRLVVEIHPWWAAKGTCLP